MKKEFPILNYPGSKRNLLEFIDKFITPHLLEEKAFFDIFAGSGAVSYFYKDRFDIYANDSELFSSVILNALLNFQPLEEVDEIIEKIDYYKEENYGNLSYFHDWLDKEKEILDAENIEELEQFYLSFPNVWKKNLVIKRQEITIEYLKSSSMYALFTTYYSGNYFGVSQSVEIDCIRYAIEKSIFNPETKSMLLASLFFAMKEAVFSKDGHMAQPLGLYNNSSRLFKQRKISIFDKFISKVKDFYSKDFIIKRGNNKVFNYSFDQLLNKKNHKLFNNVGFIYADPPYTDMQYSRYFHLLNTVVNYRYQEMTVYRGKLSKGLYTNGRYQSPLSQKSQALNCHKSFFDLCKEKQIGLGFSFAYPAQPSLQPTNRYVLNIFDLIDYGKHIFGENFQYYTQTYSHSNNRNSSTKDVLEYLLVYKPWN